MRIDLRYPLTVLSFYVPGIVLLVGAFGLGFSLEEARIFVAMFGAGVGFITVMVVGVILFESEPIWWTIPKLKEQTNDENT